MTRSRVAVTVLAMILMACGAQDVATSATASPSESPSPSPSAPASYLKALTGFRYTETETRSDVDFRSALEHHAKFGSAIHGYTRRAITFNGDPYGVIVEVFDIDPLTAGREGIQDELVSAATGRTGLRKVGLGGRAVAYVDVSESTSYLWLQGTAFVIASAQAASAGKARQIATALIDANTVESRYVVSGQVVSKQNGNPIPNVRVSVVLAGHDCCTNVVPGVVSGPTGRYLFYIPEGDYRVLLYPLGIEGFGAGWYRDASDFESAETVHVVRNTSLGESSLPAGHAISGRITSNGRPAQGAHIDVFSAAGGFVLGFDAPDNGSWLFRLAPGRYRLLFWPPEGSSAHERWWRNGDDIQHSELLIVGNDDLHDVDVGFTSGSI